MTGHPRPAFTLLMAVCGSDDSRRFEQAVASVFANSVLPDAFRLVVDGPVPAPLDHCITELCGRFPIDMLRLPHHRGLGAAMNAGLAAIETEWVVRADADDINLPNRFALQVEAMTDEIDILSGTIREVDRAGRTVGERHVPITADAIRRQMSTRSPFNHPAVAFRKDVVLACGGYPAIANKQDYLLFAALLGNGARARNLPEVLVESVADSSLYRRRGGIRYALLEVVVQRQPVRYGFKGAAAAILHGSARAFIFLLPTALRGWIYRHFLRSR